MLISLIAIKRLLKSITFLGKKWDVFNFNCLSSVLVHI